MYSIGENFQHQNTSVHCTFDVYKKERKKQLETTSKCFGLFFYQNLYLTSFIYPNYLYS